MSISPCNSKASVSFTIFGKHFDTCDYPEDTVTIFVSSKLDKLYSYFIDFPILRVKIKQNEVTLGVTSFDLTVSEFDVVFFFLICQK